MPNLSCGIVGLVKDASKGEGRGNQFLEHVRDGDVIYFRIGP